MGLEHAISHHGIKLRYVDESDIFGQPGCEDSSGYLLGLWAGGNPRPLLRAPKGHICVEPPAITKNQRLNWTGISCLGASCQCMPTRIAIHRNLQAYPGVPRCTPDALSGRSRTYLISKLS